MLRKLPTEKPTESALRLEEMLEPRRARCYADVAWCDAHLYGAVVEWAHEHKPDGTDAWEDEIIAVAMDAARRRIAYCRGNTRVGWPAVDNFCTSCQHIRPKQRKLSSLETREDGLQYFVHERYCDECVRALAEL